MRRFLSFVALVSLVACGGGESSAPGGVPLPAATATATPGNVTVPNAIKPTFTFRIPVRGTSRFAPPKHPTTISNSVASVTIILTADSTSIVPSSIAGNPAVANISSATCSSGCTVTGPPSPPGSDTYTITTYDRTNGAGNALDTNTATFTLLQGQTNSESLTLFGVPASFAIGNVPEPTAGGTLSSTAGGPANAGIDVSAFDADGNTIAGTYSQPITLTDGDTNGDGSALSSGACPGAYPVGNPGTPATTVTLASDTAAANFCYGGIAENEQTITASATGATSATADFYPQLNVPVYTVGSGTPASVVSYPDGSGYPDIALYATSGTGSTGSVTFTETGWTNYPYEQALDVFANQACSGGGESFSNYGAVPTVAAEGSSGTVVTVSAITSPSAAACPLLVTDALLSNPTFTGLSDPTSLIDTSYTTSGFSIDRRPRNTPRPN